MEKGSSEFGEKPTEADLEKLLSQFPPDLPESYLEFLRDHNGASGDLPIQPLYFQLWQIDEIIENNLRYEIQKYLPNYFGIGGNGGGEFFAFDLKTLKIFTIPFIPMNEEDALLVAECFEEFQSLMGYTE